MRFTYWSWISKQKMESCFLKHVWNLRILFYRTGNWVELLKSFICRKVRLDFKRTGICPGCILLWLHDYPNSFRVIFKPLQRRRWETALRNGDLVDRVVYIAFPTSLVWRSWVADRIACSGRSHRGCYIPSFQSHDGQVGSQIRAQFLLRIRRLRWNLW